LFFLLSLSPGFLCPNRDQESSEARLSFPHVGHLKQPLGTLPFPSFPSREWLGQRISGGFSLARWRGASWKGGSLCSHERTPGRAQAVSACFISNLHFSPPHVSFGERALTSALSKKTERALQLVPERKGEGASSRGTERAQILVLTTNVRDPLPTGPHRFPCIPVPLVTGPFTPAHRPWRLYALVSLLSWSSPGLQL
jgi:hypothetical protein